MSANRLIANQRITAAIASLFNTVPSLQPVFGAFVVDDVENEDLSMGTIALKDDKVVLFNRQWVACQDDNQIRYAMFHLALGVLHNQQGRRGDRHPRAWAVASAYVNNRLIEQHISEGSFPTPDYIVAPKGTLSDARFTDMTSEEIYETLIEEYGTLYDLEAHLADQQ